MSDQRIIVTFINQSGRARAVCAEQDCVFLQNTLRIRGQEILPLLLECRSVGVLRSRGPSLSLPPSG